MPNEEHHHPHHQVPIIINDKHYEAPKEKMTGHVLRDLPKPPIGHTWDLFLRVPGKEDEKIGNDQVVDLKPGMQFLSGIPIIIDDKLYEAPKEEMTGEELRQLPKPPIGPDRDLFLIEPGPHDDKKIGDREVVHLKRDMRFYSAPRHINPGDGSQLPESDEAYLTEKAFKWSFLPGGFLVLEQVGLAEGKYDQSSTDLMIRIPAGYPMAALDMFYVSPELRLKNGAFPPQAETMEDHGGRRWQRFSRHFQATPWRPGVDSIKTMLALALGELQGRA